jgi:succinyl-diaminopimelate desuccinylase
MEKSQGKDLVRKYFNDNGESIRKEMVKFIRILVAQETINPGPENLSKFPQLKICGEEWRVVEILERYINGNNLLCDKIFLDPLRGNLILRWGSADAAAKELCIPCHMDVVSAQNPKNPGAEKWFFDDPFSMVDAIQIHRVTGQKIHYLYGRGVLDNKGPLVASILALKAMTSLSMPLLGRMLVVALSGEENHANPDPGFDFLVKNGHLKPTYAIVPDIGENMKKIDIAEKGRLLLKVICEGKAAHAMSPELGINAIDKLAEFLVAIENIELTYKPHPLLVKPTLNTGIIAGGLEANSVPQFAEATLDIRYLPSQTADGIIADLQKVAGTIRAKAIKFEVIHDAKPHEISPDNELVKVIQSNTVELLGWTPVTFGLGGGTFAKGFNHHGILAVAFGPGEEDRFHVVNERINVDELLQFAELICLIAIDLLGVA